MTKDHILCVTFSHGIYFSSLSWKLLFGNLLLLGSQNCGSESEKCDYNYISSAEQLFGTSLLALVFELVYL